MWPQGLDDPEVSLLGLVVSSNLSMLHTHTEGELSVGHLGSTLPHEYNGIAWVAHSA